MSRKKITPLGVITFFVVFFIISPLLVIIPTSLTSVKYLSFPPVGFSFMWYEKKYSIGRSLSIRSCSACSLRL